MDRWIHGWLDRWVDGEKDSNWRLKFKPGGWDASLQAQIQACRFRFKPGGWDPSLQAQIEAWRLWSAYVSLRDQDVLGPLGISFQDYKWMTCVRDHTRSESQLHLFPTKLKDLLGKTYVSNRNVRFYDWFGFSSSQDPFPRLPEYWFYLFFACFICLFEESISFAW